MKRLRILLPMMVFMNNIAFANNDCNFIDVKVKEQNYIYDGDTFYVDIENSKKNKECLNKLFLTRKSIRVKHLDTPEIMWISKECQAKEGEADKLKCASEKKCQRFKGKKLAECKKNILCENEAGIKARDFVKDILAKNPVELRNCEKDKFNTRIACEVFVNGKEQLSDIVINAGHGIAYESGKKNKINYCKN